MWPLAHAAIGWNGEIGNFQAWGNVQGKWDGRNFRDVVMARSRKSLVACMVALSLASLAPGQGILVLPGDEFRAQAYVEPPVTGHGFAGDKDFGPSLDKFLAALRSDEYDKREEATRALLLLKPERLDDVREALAQETDPEAASRLQQVAVHLYLKARTPVEGAEPLIGVRQGGVSFELMQLDPRREDVQMTIAILEIERGFPAAQVLFPGDRIVAIDGERFEITEAMANFDSDVVYFSEFRAKVVKHKAGSLLKFTVMRGGKMLDVEVQTASLARPGVPLETAMERRSEAVRRFVQGLRSGVRSVTVALPGEMPSPLTR